MYKTQSNAWATGELPMPSGAKESDPKDISCTSATTCTMVGSFKNSEGNFKPLVESLSGFVWTVQSTPDPGKGDAWLNGVSCPSITYCVATGAAYAGGSNFHNLAEVYR
jgi:hypothetical protein